VALLLLLGVFDGGDVLGPDGGRALLAVRVFPQARLDVGADGDDGDSGGQGVVERLLHQAGARPCPE
jgi:hypothetical protein